MGHAVNEFLGGLVVNSDIGGRAGRRVLTMHQIERRMAGTDMDPVVVGEFRDGQPVDPIILVVVDEETQVLL